MYVYAYIHTYTTHTKLGHNSREAYAHVRMYICVYMYKYLTFDTKKAFCTAVYVCMYVCRCMCQGMCFKMYVCVWIYSVYAYDVYVCMYAYKHALH